MIGDAVIGPCVYSHVESVHETYSPRCADPMPDLLFWLVMSVLALAAFWVLWGEHKRQVVG